MSASGGKLSAVTKVLSGQWQQTKDQVEKLVAKIRSDCE